MEWFRIFTRRRSMLFRRGQFDADLEEEMRLHRSCPHILKAFHGDSALHGERQFVPRFHRPFAGHPFP